MRPLPPPLNPVPLRQPPCPLLLLLPLPLLYILVCGVAFTAATIPEHQCIHDDIVNSPEHRYVNHVVDEQDYGYAHERSLQSGELPIRVVFDTSFLDGDTDRTCYTAGAHYKIGSPGSCCTPVCSSSVTSNCWGTCTSDDVLTTQKKDYLVSTIIPAAKTWLESALSLTRVSGSLTVSAGTCGALGGVTVGSGYSQPNADIVLFLTARPNTGTTIAYATQCRQDAHNRPTAGQVNWGPAQMSLVASDLEQQVSVGIHEVCHALGFSSSKFSEFIDSSGNVLPYTSVVGTRSQLGANSVSYSVNQIVTATVVSHARDHFGCTSLTGAELEDGGGSGTAGSHWEKRVFNNEFLTGTISLLPVRSAMTIALLQDTGYYVGNFSAAQTLLWGKSQGCSFVTGPCTASNWPTLTGYHCNTQSAQGCHFDRKSLAYCNLVTYSGALPTQYQYFTSPQQGGSSSIMDYCAVNVPYTNGDCSVAANAGSNAALFGETYAGGSLCFMSSLLQSAFVYSGTVSARCYTTTCISTSQLQITVDSTAYDCPAGGGSITVPGYNGAITCPDPTEVCSTAGDPTFQTIAPNVGPDNGGTPVTILGSNFRQGTTTISIGGASCTGVTVDSATQMKCVTGSSIGTDAAVDVSITNVAKTFTGVGAFTYSLNYPNIDSVSPTMGPAYGGRNITISGSNFTAGTLTVWVGGVACINATTTGDVVFCLTQNAFSSLTNTSSTTTVTVVVVDGAGKTAYGVNKYTWDPSWPRITSVFPNGGTTTGGFVVVFNGNNFTSGGTASIDSVSCTSVTYVDSTEIACVAPSHAVGTGLTVKYVDSSSRDTELTGAMQYATTWPSVTGVEPTFGPAFGGRNITISGSGFNTTVALMSASVDSVNCPIVAIPNNATIVCTTPSVTVSTKQNVSIGVTNTATGQQALGYRIYNVDPKWPQLLSSLPNGGGIGGGATVRLDGRQFNSSLSYSIWLKGVPCTNITVRTTTVITCLAGSTSSGNIGVGDIALVDQYQRDSNLTGGVWQYDITWPTVTSIAPTVGPFYGGRNITFAGSLFNTTLNITIHGQNCTNITRLSESLVVCTSPAISGLTATTTFDVLLAQPSPLKQVLSYQAYSFDPKWPRFDRVFPTGARNTGGSNIYVYGINFNASTSPSISLDGVSCTPVVVVSSTLMYCTTTAAASNVTYSQGAVVVSDSLSRSSASYSREFTISSSWPCLTAVTPDAGPERGGTVVTLSGCFNCSLTRTIHLGIASCTATTGPSNCSSTAAVCTSGPRFVQANKTVDTTMTNSNNEQALLINSYTFINRIRPSPPVLTTAMCGIISLDCVFVAPGITVVSIFLIMFVVAAIKQMRYIRPTAR